MTAATARSATRSERSSLPPDLPVRLPVARRVPGGRALAVVGRGDVHRCHVSAVGTAREGAVEFVDDLPALEGQRLGHGGGLVLPAVHALEGGRVAVAGSDVEGWAGALLTGGAERGGGVGEVQVVDGHGVGPAVLEAGQQGGDLLRGAGAGVGDR